MSIKSITPQYYDYLRSEKWARIRQQVIERDERCCRVCGNKQHLEVHHINGKHRFHEDKHPECLMTLCRGCHEIITRYFMQCDLLREWYESRRRYS